MNVVAAVVRQRGLPFLYSCSRVGDDYQAQLPDMLTAEQKEQDVDRIVDVPLTVHKVSQFEQNIPSVSRVIRLPFLRAQGTWLSLTVLI